MTAATADNAKPSKETRTSMYHFLVLLDPICVTPLGAAGAFPSRWSSLIYQLFPLHLFLG